MTSTTKDENSDDEIEVFLMRIDRKFRITKINWI